MISKKHRFTSDRAINAVYKRGGTSRSGHLSLKYTPAQGEDYKLAVVVSKKVSKSAVVRNRIRRRIFEFVRKNALSPAEIKQNLVITVFSEEIAEIPEKNLEKTVSQLFERAGIKL